LGKQDTQEPTSLKQAFQNIIPQDVTILQGTVISASPLRIQVINDEKLVLSSNLICLPKHLTNYKMTVDISGGSAQASFASGGSHEHGSGGGHTHDNGTHDGHKDDNNGTHGHTGGSHSHGVAGDHLHAVSSFSITGATMTIDNALKTGETVYILSFNKGKKYYILDRGA